MSIIASVILGMDGLFYLALGISMICLYHIPILQSFIMLYPSLFKMFKPLQVTGEDEESEPLMTTPSLLIHELGFRVLGYFLILLGVFRAITALHWYDLIFIIIQWFMIPIKFLVNTGIVDTFI